VIFISDAIADPRAVMIHSEDTFVASTAVMGSFGLPEVTIFALLGIIRGGVSRDILL